MGDVRAMFSGLVESVAMPEIDNWVSRDKWDTQCGEAWQFSNDFGVAENGVRFCPFCGGRIEAAGGGE